MDHKGFDQLALVFVRDIFIFEEWQIGIPINRQARRGRFGIKLWGNVGHGLSLSASRRFSGSGSPLLLSHRERT